MKGEHYKDPEFFYSSPLKEAGSMDSIAWKGGRNTEDKEKQQVIVLGRSKQKALFRNSPEKGQ